ncbi:MAG: ABC transporter permease [Thermomicrobiales bacterium]
MLARQAESVDGAGEATGLAAGEHGRAVRRPPGALARLGAAFRSSPTALVSLIFLIVLFALTIGAPLVARYNPTTSVLTDFEQPPSAKHWLGTDGAGRDIWSRLVWGGRNTLFISCSAVLIATTIGTLVGAVSGVYRGRLDGVLMRVTDAFLAFPSIVLILMLASVLGPSIINVVLVLGVLSWTGIARLVRGQFLLLREQDWVLSARAVGVGNRRLIFRHLLPHVLSQVLVAATFGAAGAALAEASLSYLGLGVKPPTPSWGSMLSDAQSIHVLQSVPWSWLAPGVTLTLAVLAINDVGDTLRRALDPYASTAH